VKTLISSSTPPPVEAIENQENRRQTKAQAKNKGVGKCDAVMNKIAKSQAEEKAKPKPKLKEVKSRVFASLTLQPTSLNDSKTAINNNNNNNNNNNRGSSPFRTTGNMPSRPSSARARREILAAPKPKA